MAVYDVSGAASDRNCVVLSDIHIDIMDYIQPASCTDAEFRQMWAEFEWENKVQGRPAFLEAAKKNCDYRRRTVASFQYRASPICVGPTANPVQECSV